MKQFKPKLKLIMKMKIEIEISGLLGDNANLLELSNMLEGLGGSDDFLSKRRMDVGDDDDEDDEVNLPASKSKSTLKLASKSTSKSASTLKKLPKSQRLTNDVGDLGDISNLGDLSSLLEMLTSESQTKNSQVF
jgi:hypothetical protein